MTATAAPLTYLDEATRDELTPRCDVVTAYVLEDVDTGEKRIIGPHRPCRQPARWIVRIRYTHCQHAHTSLECDEHAAGRIPCTCACGCSHLDARSCEPLR